MPASPAAWEIRSVSGFFNRGVFEWTVHEDETVERDVAEEMSADCSLRPNKLFPIRRLIERHWRSHLENNGGTAGSCTPLARKGGPIASKGRCAMKNYASPNRYLSAAFALAAIVTAGALPASAQSRDHTGSMMPFYYDETGAQKTGAWSKQEEAGTANLQAAQPAQPLYMYAGKRPPHHGARVH
jgi:hypothetical protein